MIVIERTRTGFSAYSPDIEGCVATARTRRSVVSAMQKAVEFHLDGMRRQGRRWPVATSDFAFVEVPRG
jgi:predicted RNase H-like HicB family nuclease